MSVPLPEDQFIGKLRRCVECGKSRPMYWIPDKWWRAMVEPKRQKQHICFHCFVGYLDGMGPTSDETLDELIEGNVDYDPAEFPPIDNPGSEI